MRAYHQPEDLFRDTWVHAQKNRPLIKNKPPTVHTVGMIEPESENRRPFDVQPSLNSRTTSKSRKTRTDAFIKKRATLSLKDDSSHAPTWLEYTRKKLNTYAKSDRRSIDERE